MLSEEAIAHRAALSGAVRVKPLVWLLEQDDVLVSNTSGLRQYRIAFDGRAARVCLRNGLWVKCETEDGAKAVAQADYEARILSALEPVHNAERAELARQNAALRAQVASLTADNEALQRTVAKMCAAFNEITDPKTIWCAIDGVYGFYPSRDDYAAAVSKAQRAGWEASK